MNDVEAEYNSYPFKMFVPDGSVEFKNRLIDHGVEFKSNRYKLFQFKNEIDFNIAKLLR